MAPPRALFRSGRGRVSPCRRSSRNSIDSTGRPGFPLLRFRAAPGFRTNRTSSSLTLPDPCLVEPVRSYGTRRQRDKPPDAIAALSPGQPTARPPPRRRRRRGLNRHPPRHAWPYDSLPSRCPDFARERPVPNLGQFGVGGSRGSEWCRRQPRESGAPRKLQAPLSTRAHPESVGPSGRRLGATAMVREAGLSCAATIAGPWPADHGPQLEG